MFSFGFRFAPRGVVVAVVSGLVVATMAACQPDNTPQPASSSSAPAAQPSSGGGDNPGTSGAPVKGLMDIKQVPLYQSYKWQWAPMNADQYAATKLMSVCNTSADEGFGQIWMEGNPGGGTVKATTGVQDPAQVGKQDWAGQEIILQPKDANGRTSIKQYMLEDALKILNLCRKSPGTAVTVYSSSNSGGVGGFAAKIVVRKPIGDVVLHDYFVVQSNGVAAELALWDSPLHTTNGNVAWPSMDERSIQMELVAALNA